LKNPTELEQVEDVLDSLVEMVSEEVSADQRVERHYKWLKVSRNWHASTRGYKMKKLSDFLTDVPYMDLYISHTHNVLSQSIPTDVLNQRLPQQSSANSSSFNRSPTSALNVPSFRKLAAGLPRLLMPLSHLTYQKSISNQMKTLSKTFRMAGVRAKRISTVLLSGGDWKKNRYDMMFEEMLENNGASDGNMLEHYSEGGHDSSSNQRSVDGSESQNYNHPRETNVKHAPCLQVKILLDVDPPPMYVMRSRFSLLDVLGKPFGDDKLGNVVDHGDNTKMPVAEKHENLDSPKRETTRNRRVAFKATASDTNHRSFLHHHQLQAKVHQFPVIPTTKQPVERKSSQYFDTSARTAFEKILVRDLARACCLPERHVTLEEIRKLPQTDDRISKAKVSLMSIDAEKRRHDDELRRAIIIENRYRVSLNRGSYDEFFADEENFHLVKDFFTLYPSSTQLDSACPGNPNFFRHVHKFDSAEDMRNYQPSSPISRRLKSSPGKPSRKSELKSDDQSAYWLIKDIQGITESQLQQLRIMQLKLHREEKDLRSRMLDLKTYRQELVDHVNDLSYNARKSLMPMIRSARTSIHNLSNDFLASLRDRISIMDPNKNRKHPVEIVELINEMCLLVQESNDPEELQNSKLAAIEDEYDHISGKLEKIQVDKESLKQKELVLIHASSRRLKKLSSKIRNNDDEIDIESDDEIGDCIDEFEYNRKQRLDRYPSLIVNTIYTMVLAVEDALTSSDDHVIDAYVNIRSRYQEDSHEVKSSPPVDQTATHTKYQPEATRSSINTDKARNACEVTFTIFLNEEICHFPGFTDITIEDIAQMLVAQYKDTDSTLRNGSITRNLLELKHTSNHDRKRDFESWESYWVHSIHPSFYGYSAMKKASFPKQKPFSPKPLNIVNPIDTLPKPSQDLFSSLDAKQKEFRIAKARVDRRKKLLEEKAHREAAMLHEQDDDDINSPAPLPPSQLMLLPYSSTQLTSNFKKTNADDDELGDEDLDDAVGMHTKKGMKRVRPSHVLFSHRIPITKSDVNKLLKVYESYNRRYNVLLAHSQKHLANRIVGDQNIPLVVYDAKKKRDDAHRTYLLAKRKYERRNLETIFDPPKLPMLSLQSLPDETIEKWANEENEEKLKELRTFRDRGIEAKEARAHAAKIRDQQNSARAWFISKFIDLTDEPKIAAKVLYESLGKDVFEDNLKDQVSKVRHMRQDKKQRAENAMIISEEKRTKQLYHIVSSWAQQSSADVPYPLELPPVQQLRSRQNSGIGRSNQLSRDTSNSQMILNRQPSRLSRRPSKEGAYRTSNIETLNRLDKNLILQFLEVVNISIREFDSRRLFLSRQSQLQQRLLIHARRNQAMIDAIAREPSSAEPQTVLRSRPTVSIAADAVRVESNPTEVPALSSIGSLVRNPSEQIASGFEFTPLQRLSSFSKHLTDTLDKLSALAEDIPGSQEAESIMRRQSSKSSEPQAVMMTRRPSIDKSTYLESRTSGMTPTLSHNQSIALPFQADNIVSLDTVGIQPSSFIPQMKTQYSCSDPHVISQTVSMDRSQNGYQQRLDSLSAKVPSLKKSTTSSSHQLSSHFTRSHSGSFHAEATNKSRLESILLSSNHFQSSKHPSDGMRPTSRADSSAITGARTEDHDELLLLEEIKAEYDSVKKALDEHVPLNLRLHDDDIELLRPIQWLSLVYGNSIISECFKQYPTETVQSFSIDEITQVYNTIIALCTSRDY
jgi:hypothetical protein